MTTIAGPGVLGASTIHVQKSNQDQILQKAAAFDEASADTASPKKGGDVAKIQQLSRDFEAIFTGIMLKSMRDSVQKSGLIDGGNAEDIYRSMLDSEYSKVMASQGSGLAKTIEEYLMDVSGLKANLNITQDSLKQSGQLNAKHTGLAAYKK